MTGADKFSIEMIIAGDEMLHKVKAGMLIKI
jgi:hypothetical protein